ncbi:MAG: hypothetical protein C0392_14650 [Syntrophus sp. (in: bacteria)]|nr:hypothetical protein [Syntrophus sp. (in: bacteria)]
MERRKGTCHLISQSAIFRFLAAFHSPEEEKRLRYTLEGGTITVATEESDGQYVRIEVSDTGIGIEPEYLPNIFNRFYRTERAWSHYPQGAGLGFSIVKSIMTLHNGTVAV